MKLSEIVASLTELKQTVASFIGDKAKATGEALTAFSLKLSTLETGAVAELTQKSADLITAQQTIGTLTGQLEKAQGEVNTLGGSLKSACTDLNLNVGEAATSAEMVTALKDGVSATLAKMNVNPKNIPAAKATTTQSGDEAKKSRADFAAMSPAQQLAFCKAGGKITD
jgi:hypothetical protein